MGVPGRLERLPVVPLLLLLLVAHLLNAVVTVEIFRRVLPRSETWSDKRHFSIVGIVWLAFFAAGSALVSPGGLHSGDEGRGPSLACDRRLTR